ncbi:MAG: hypothetical protein AAF696_04325 [Bacteroidota bacterium]
MKTYYWLEIWTDPGKHEKISKILGHLPSKEPRSILKFFEEERSEEPQWYKVESFLDIVEDKFDELESLGVQRKDISIWMNCAYEDESCDISLEPSTLLRLGEEGIRPCISCWKGEAWEDFLEAESKPSFRHVEIVDIWIEREGAGEEMLGGRAEVTLSFDDGSVWTANFVTFQYMRSLLRSGIQDGQYLKGSYYWDKNSILIGSLKRVHIEKVIVELLEQRHFESAFVRKDVPNESDAEPGLTMMELSIIHEEGLEIEIEEILGIQEPYILKSNNFWVLKKVREESEPFVDYLGYFLDLLEDNYEALSSIGIQRRDIQINWTHQYEGSCNLELRPEILKRLGKNGIGLNLSCRQAALSIARCLN